MNHPLPNGMNLERFAMALAQQESIQAQQYAHQQIAAGAQSQEAVTTALNDQQQLAEQIAAEQPVHETFWQKLLGDFEKVLSVFVGGSSLTGLLAGALATLASIIPKSKLGKLVTSAENDVEKAVSDVAVKLGTLLHLPNPQAFAKIVQGAFNLGAASAIGMSPLVLMQTNPQLNPVTHVAEGAAMAIKGVTSDKKDNIKEISSIVSTSVMAVAAIAVSVVLLCCGQPELAVPELMTTAMDLMNAYQFLSGAEQTVAGVSEGITTLHLASEVKNTIASSQSSVELTKTIEEILSLAMKAAGQNAQNNAQEISSSNQSLPTLVTPGFAIAAAI